MAEGRLRKTTRWPAVPQNPLREFVQLRDVTSRKVQSAPPGLRALLVGGRTSLFCGDRETAMHAYREAERIAWNAVSVYLCWAELWLQADRPDRALLALEQARRASPSSADVRLVLERVKATLAEHGSPPSSRSGSPGSVPPASAFRKIRQRPSQPPPRGDHDESTPINTDSMTLRALRASERDFTSGSFPHLGSPARTEAPQALPRPASVPAPRLSSRIRRRRRMRRVALRKIALTFAALALPAAVAWGGVNGFQWGTTSSAWQTTEGQRDLERWIHQGLEDAQGAPDGLRQRREEWLVAGYSPQLPLEQAALAVLLLLEGKVDVAAQTVEKAKLQAPTDPNVALVQHYIRQWRGEIPVEVEPAPEGKPRSISAPGMPVVRQVPRTRAEHAHQLLRSARLAAGSGDSEAAAKDIHDAVQASRRDIPLLLAVAQTALQLHQDQGVEEATKVVLGRVPEHAWARRLRVDARIARGDGTGAVTALRELPLTEPRDHARALARAALLQEKPAVVEEALNSLTALAPGNDDAKAIDYALRGRLQLRKGRSAAAVVEDLRHLATRRVPDVVLAWVEAASRAGAATSVQSDARWLEEEALDHQDVRYVLSEWQAAQGHWAEARTHLEFLLRDAPLHRPARSRLADVLVQVGALEPATQAHEQLIAQLATAGAELSVLRQERIRLVRLLIRQGLVERAESELSTLATAGEDEVLPLRLRLELAKGNPNDVVARVAQHSRPNQELLGIQGDALLLIDKPVHARRAFLRALKEGPLDVSSMVGWAEAEWELGHFRMANLALTRTEHVLRREQVDPQLRARFLAALGRTKLFLPRQIDAALAALQEAVELPAPPSDVYFWLGVALQRARVPGHRAALERYLQAAPEGPYRERAQRLLRADVAGKNASL